MSLQKCAPVKSESLKFFGQEKLVRVIECSSYQKLVYNLPVHVFFFFFERDQFIKKLILRPSQIKKLLTPPQIKKRLKEQKLFLL